MSFQGLCPKCQILLFDVKGIDGFGGSEKITCRSCGRVYIVAEEDGQVIFKRDTRKRFRKASLS